MPIESKDTTTQKEVTVGQRLMDPTGVTEKVEGSIAHRPPTLDGAVVGLLWNKKFNGDKLLNAVAELLKNEYQIKEVLFESAGDAGKPTPPPVLDALAARCDAVLTATGD